MSWPFGLEELNFFFFPFCFLWVYLASIWGFPRLTMDGGSYNLQVAQWFNQRGTCPRCTDMDHWHPFGYAPFTSACAGQDFKFAKPAWEPTNYLVLAYLIYISFIKIL
ncbi:hypothetical protein B0T22DRAFT_449623 [Podospora appendiculata]|uniref:Uncharacterized protein n=1 Tax=Podospora appendiculata TaxID=314037 RepID=A0AAE0XH43_9PEZI|nr:hypothetical protein B0T22DRAFT_449623 [Podospora appendiculata]